MRTGKPQRSTKTHADTLEDGTYKENRMSDTDRIQELSAALEAEKVKNADLLVTAAATAKEHEKAIEKAVRDWTKQIEEHAPEAIYSITVDKQGAAMFTVRARPGESGESYLIRFDKMTAKMRERGFCLRAETTQANAPQPAPGNGTAPAPSPAPEIVTDGGTVRAILMKIGKSYTGNKPQLQFEVEGMEHPLSYTRSVAEMMKLLAPVGQYSPEMLTDGKKYAVNYLVDWRLGDPNAEGKRYRNIVAVKPA
mgnify:CR=1 FL=1